MEAVEKRLMKRIQTQIKDSELVQKKQLQIATGASKLFIKKGFFRTGMREISKATGLTIGNLYDYIERKEDVLYLVFDVFHSVWASTLEKEGVFEIEDPMKQLETAVRKMLEIVNTYRDMVLLIYTESKLLPKDFLKIILEKESGLVKCFERILRKGIKKRVFKVRDPFFLANVIVYLLSIEALRGWNLRGVYKPEEINKLVIEFVKKSVKG
jgi:AcrR family transcriptional regulator